MAYFPLFLNLDSADVLVVGGGQTALRKCRSVLAFGADVTVISPEFAGEFPNQAHLVKRRFQPGDTTGRRAASTRPGITFCPFCLSI